LIGLKKSGEIEMNLQKIKEILELGIPDGEKENYILGVIADDENAIPTIMKILDHERQNHKELIQDTNNELSRAVVVLNDKSLKWGKKIIAEPSWIVEQVKKHYKKWHEYIRCNYPFNDELEKIYGRDK
jgi:DNA-binding transcriptional MerR regulator